MRTNVVLKLINHASALSRAIQNLLRFQLITIFAPITDETEFYLSIHPTSFI